MSWRVPKLGSLQSPFPVLWFQYIPTDMDQFWTASALLAASCVLAPCCVSRLARSVRPFRATSMSHTSHTSHQQYPHPQGVYGMVGNSRHREDSWSIMHLMMSCTASVAIQDQPVYGGCLQAERPLLQCRFPINNDSCSAPCWLQVQQSRSSSRVARWSPSCAWNETKPQFAHRSIGQPGQKHVACGMAGATLIILRCDPKMSKAMVQWRLASASFSSRTRSSSSRARLRSWKLLCRLECGVIC